MRSEEVGEAPVLLCRTGAPYLCSNGNCCDIAPSCDYLCNGG
ncbi:MAG: hypothetical protein U0228_33465 [Myxococcaceae bacterium]